MCIDTALYDTTAISVFGTKVYKRLENKNFYIEISGEKASVFSGI